MGLIYALLLILILSCVIGIIYIIHFNKLQDCKVKIDEAESIIDEALRAKYDTLIKTTNIIKSSIDDNKINFKDLESLKEENISNFDLERKLNDSIILIDKIKEDYKEQTDTKDLRSLNNEIKRADEKISAAKKYYNKYVSISNELVRKFPSNIIAKLHGITIKNFFDGKDMNDDILDDFKF